jgi:hypothetical protein
MKTKTLILTALLAVAGAATSSAQVYSLNVVGYVNQAVPSGFSMIANQLQGTSTKIADIFNSTTTPNNTAVFKYTGSGYASMTLVDGFWEGDNVDLTLAPGEGAFVSTPSSFTNTFVGEVVLNSTNVVPSGFSIRSSVVPQSGAIDTVLNYQPGNNDAVFLYQPTTKNYKGYTFVDGGWESDDGTVSPSPKVGESFFIFNAGAQKNWVRNFTVN